MASVGEIQGAISAQQGIISANNGEIAAADAKIVADEAQKLVAKGKIAWDNLWIGNKNDDITELTALQTKLGTLQSSVESKESSRMTQLAAFNNYSYHEKMAEKYYNGMEKTISGTDYATATQGITDAGTKIQTKITALNAEIEELNTDLAAQNTKITNLDADIAAQKSKIAACRSAISSAQGAIGGLQAQMSSATH